MALAWKINQYSRDWEQYLEFPCRKCGDKFVALQCEPKRSDPHAYIFLNTLHTGKVLYEGPNPGGRPGLNRLMRELENLMKVHDRELHQ